VDTSLTIDILTGLAAIGLLLVLLLWWVARHHRSIPENQTLWQERNYTCVQCGIPMQQGWVLMGKGAIWSERTAGRPGSFALITAALPNTISLRFRPAANMAWRCTSCQLVLIDHSKLVH
jgi:hypothetical protein